MQDLRGAALGYKARLAANLWMESSRVTAVGFQTALQ